MRTAQPEQTCKHHGAPLKPEVPWWLSRVQHQARGLLLYLAHALWLAAGLGWLVLVTFWDRRPLRWQLAAATGLLPTCALILAWYPSLSGAGWGSPSAYGPSVISRLSLSGLTNATLGGLRSWLEPLAMLALLLWIGFGLWQHRRRLGEIVDWRLLAAAIIFLLMAILLPDKVDRTLRFALRWPSWPPTALPLRLPGVLSSATNCGASTPRSPPCRRHQGFSVSTSCATAHG